MSTQQIDLPHMPGSGYLAISSARCERKGCLPGIEEGESMKMIFLVRGTNDRVKIARQYSRGMHCSVCPTLLSRALPSRITMHLR